MDARLPIEGDGWVNWSDLATLIRRMTNALDRIVDRLLVPPAP